MGPSGPIHIVGGIMENMNIFGTQDKLPKQYGRILPSVKNSAGLIVEILHIHETYGLYCMHATKDRSYLYPNEVEILKDNVQGDDVIVLRSLYNVASAALCGSIGVGPQEILKLSVEYLEKYDQSTTAWEILLYELGMDVSFYNERLKEFKDCLKKV
jgi:hypothetical protein